MNSDNLSRYLNNHLAGAKASVDLLAALVDRPDEGEQRDFFLKLLGEIHEDRKVLEGILDQLGLRESSLCAVGGKVTAMASRMKLMWDGWDDGDLGLLEALEVLLLGVAGKSLLWGALQDVASLHPALGKYDFETLQEQAKEQKERIEAQRMREVRRVLAEG